MKIAVGDYVVYNIVSRDRERMALGVISEVVDVEKLVIRIRCGEDAHVMLTVVEGQHIVLPKAKYGKNVMADYPDWHEDICCKYLTREDVRRLVEVGIDDVMLAVERD